MVLRARTDGSVVVLDLEGQLDFEATQQLQEAYASVKNRHGEGPVVFNLGRLRFVGSSGINHFLRVLKDFHTNDEKPKFCQLSPEFDRLFRAFQSAKNPFHIYSDESEAVAASQAEMEAIAKRIEELQKLAPTEEPAEIEMAAKTKTTAPKAKKTTKRVTTPVAKTKRIGKTKR